MYIHQCSYKHILTCMQQRTRSAAQRYLLSYVGLGSNVLHDFHGFISTSQLDTTLTRAMPRSKTPDACHTERCSWYCVLRDSARYRRAGSRANQANALQKAAKKQLVCVRCMRSRLEQRRPHKKQQQQQPADAAAATISISLIACCWYSTHTHTRLHTAIAIV